MTVDMATKMINEQGTSLITQPALLEAAYQDEMGTTEGIPEVVATFQDLNTIGIRHDGTQLPKTPTKDTDKSTRLMKERGLDIIEDEADFIA